MPEESHYVLPKKKPDYWLLSAFGIFVGVMAVLVGGFAIREWWVFTHMTAKDHLWEAKVALDTPADLGLSLRHLEAIPTNSAEATKAQVLEKEVRHLESERKNAEYDRIIAKAN